MSRLTNYSRDQIVMAALAHAFDKRKADLEIQEDRLAREAVTAHFGEDVLKKMARLPKGWLPTYHYVHCTGPGLSCAQLHLKNGIPAAASFNRQIVVDDPLAAQIAEHQSAENALREEREELQRKIRAAVQKASTVEALIKLWPEIEPILPKSLAAGAPVYLPAIPIADLNKAIGLPVKEAVAA